MKRKKKKKYERTTSRRMTGNVSKPVVIHSLVKLPSETSCEWFRGVEQRRSEVGLVPMRVGAGWRGSVGRGWVGRDGAEGCRQGSCGYLSITMQAMTSQWHNVTLMVQGCPQSLSQDPSLLFTAPSRGANGRGFATAETINFSFQFFIVVFFSVSQNFISFIRITNWFCNQ